MLALREPHCSDARDPCKTRDTSITRDICNTSDTCEKGDRQWRIS